ncbi:hypothetical protein, partial [Bacillus licheniformis]|uniref:hypothetical protein n=1 Tax=Bacillus licheniformis TaxID=1402 RepID=UPI003C12BBC2
GKKKWVRGGKREYEKGWGVVCGLRVKGDEWERDLKGYLKKEEKQGEVKKMRWYYIVNGMGVHGRKEVMEEV